jgi:hypothetical protein
MEDLAAEAAVTQKRTDILVACEAPVAIVFPFEDWCRRPDLVVSRIGIVEKVSIARIERDGTPVDVDFHRRLH